MMVDVLVLGGGMAGLTTAYYLRKRGLSVKVIEQEKEVGGRARSLCLEDLCIDLPAQFFANFYRRTRKLIEEVGLGNQILWLQGKTGVVADERVTVLPPHSAALLRLLPWRSRYRLLKLQLSVIRHTNKLDIDNVVSSHSFDTESVAAFADKALDFESLNYLIAPIVRGLFYWDMATTSKAFLYILFKYALMMRVFNFRRGIRVLPDTLAKGLDVQLRTRALRADYCETTGGWQTTVQNEGNTAVINSKAVVCTIPATHINPVIQCLPSAFHDFFDQIDYSSNTITHMILKDRIEVPYYALFYPPHQNKKVSVVNLQSRKYDDGETLKRDTISVFPSSEYSRELMRMSDSAVIDEVTGMLCGLHPFEGLNVRTCIERSVVTRVEQALPILDVHYIRRLKKFQNEMSQALPEGLFFAGDYIGGPSIEGAVVSAERNLERVVGEVAR
jgi:oxygen-dependent protoporphyrinogen oxidase